MSQLDLQLYVQLADRLIEIALQALMEPIEKAVLKALEAKRERLSHADERLDNETPAPEIDVLEATVSSKLTVSRPVPERPIDIPSPASAPTKAPKDIDTDHSPRQKHIAFRHAQTSETQPALVTTKLKGVPIDEKRTLAESHEEARRQDARKQLFPSRTTPSERPLERPTEEPSSDKIQTQADTHDSDQPALSKVPTPVAVASISKVGPNGSLAMLDPKKLDELINDRLQQEVGSGRAARNESSPDSLNVLKLLDRELGLWEKALRAGNMQTIHASRERSLDLLSQIPTALAQPLEATITMMSNETEALHQPQGGEATSNSETSPITPAEAMPTVSTDKNGNDDPSNDQTIRSKRRRRRRRR